MNFSSSALGLGLRSYSWSKSCVTICYCFDVCHKQMRLLRAGHLLLFYRPEILRMSELNDNSELQSYSSAVLYILSAVTPPTEYVEAILDNFIFGIKSSTVKSFFDFWLVLFWPILLSQSWRVRLHALPALVVFFYRNLLSISQDGVAKVMDILLDCLADENVEVREMASKMFSGVVRCSQRQSILLLKVAIFVISIAIWLNWLYEIESVRYAC